MGPPEKAGPDPLQLGGGGGYGAGETNPLALMGSDGLRRLDRYGKAKASTLRVLEAVGQEAAKAAGVRFAKMAKCGDWLLFRHFPTRRETKLRSANFCCVHLLCTFCAIRRGARMMARYLERFQHIRARHPELSPYLVTFTVRNGPDLAERLAHLERCLTTLHKRRLGKRSRSLLRDIKGAVWSYEVTYSADKGWHPHVHAVYLASELPDQVALRDEWEGITKDSFMCDVRPIQASEVQDESDLCDRYAKGFAEVFKYALKSAELPPAQALEAFKVMSRRRLVRSFGEFYGVYEPSAKDLADELPLEDLPYIDLLWKFSGGCYEHARTINPDAASRIWGSSPAGVSSGPVPLAAGGLRGSSGRTEQCGRVVAGSLENLSAQSPGVGPKAIL